MSYFGFASGGPKEEAYTVRLDGLGFGTDDNTGYPAAVFFFRTFGVDGGDGAVLRLCMTIPEVRRTHAQCEELLTEFENWQRQN